MVNEKNSDSQKSNENDVMKQNEYITVLLSMTALLLAVVGIAFSMSYDSSDKGQIMAPGADSISLQPYVV